MQIKVEEQVDRATERLRECTVKTCKNIKRKAADLVCDAHWKLTPKPLKQAYLTAEKSRKTKRKGPEVFAAANAIIEYLADHVGAVAVPDMRPAVLSENSTIGSERRSKGGIILP